jgi:predicted ester cyclase
MTTDQNKATARRFVEEGINKSNWAVITETQDAKFVDHQPTPAGFPTGPEGFKQYLTAFRTAFPDLRYSIDDEIAEGDKVVQRVTGHGTMKGAFAGMLATNKHADWSEIHITRFTSGKVVEHWGSVDQDSMFQQLGVKPAAMPIPA